MSIDSGERRPLSTEERARLDAIRAAETLADLLAIVDAGNVEEAYLEAKTVWKRLRQREMDPPERFETGEGAGLPGDRVDVDGTPYWVHGITHADTDEERSYCRSHVRAILETGGAVYCEQGIREMYFADVAAVHETDDYRWALARSLSLPTESRVAAGVDGAEDGRSGTPGGSPVGGEQHEKTVEGGDVPGHKKTGIGVDLQSLTSQFREVTFSLIDSGSDVYGDRFARVLGDIASDFLLSHEDLATGEDYEAFRLLRTASTDPSKLPALQQYYRCAFLPQPLEREWLRRHDPELELFTHARSERIAASVLAASDDARTVHVFTGAAHQPGVTYYLERYRDGEWDFRPFEAV